MKKLLNKLKSAKKSNLSKLVNNRIKEFESLHDSKIFSELCFCLLTANFQAEKSIKIQNDLKNRFHILSEEQLVQALRHHGHRFPNMRAKFIFEARKHYPLSRKKLDSEKDKREWIVKNVKGLGMKEASHFLRNIGYKDYAIIDFHIIDILAEHKLIEKPKNKSLSPKKYIEIESVLKKVGSKAKLNQAELDLYLWYLETGKVLK